MSKVKRECSVLRVQHGALVNETKHRYRRNARRAFSRFSLVLFRLLGREVPGGFLER